MFLHMSHSRKPRRCCKVKNMFRRIAGTATRPRPRTVLLVDDDPVWLASTCRAVGAEYPVLTAVCGEDTLRVARMARPDLIILSIMVPGGDGCFRILAELENDPATRDTTFIVVSEGEDAVGLEFGNAEFYRQFGSSVHAFLERSVSSERLMEEVTKAIWRVGAGRELVAS